MSTTTRGVGDRGEAVEFLGVVPDDVEEGADAAHEVATGLAALAVFQRREIGGRHVRRLGHVLELDIPPCAHLAQLGAERRHGASPLIRFNST